MASEYTFRSRDSDVSGKGIVAKSMRWGKVARLMVKVARKQRKGRKEAGTRHSPLN